MELAFVNDKVQVLYCQQYMLKNNNYDDQFKIHMGLAMAYGRTFV